jgi:5-methyltetrahydropteroyltriglutamate--homocysteine methyltransferase
MATRYHAEHVGSLLRPPELLEARRARRQGGVSPERLRELEDRAALEAIELQREAGREVFTDGEMRRDTWMAGLLESLGGVVPVPTDDSRGVGWYRDGAQDPSPQDTRFDVVAVSGKLSLDVPLTSLEAAFLEQHAPGPYKITMMSPSMGPMLWRPGVSEQAYGTVMDMVRDLAQFKVGEIEGLLDQGVGWIQLDSLSYNQVIDPQFRTRLGGVRAATDPNAVLDMSVAVDNELIRAARRRKPDVTIGLHMCRGNNRSAWMARGSYEPVAEGLLGEVDVDRFLLEYDTDRAGGFEPLRFVPGGKTVVLGLVSSKVPQLESQDELRRRIDEASRYIPLEDLALSPQCGFASTAAGNLLTVDEERRKLELVVDTARRVWG